MKTQAQLLNLSPEVTRQALAAMRHNALKPAWKLATDAVGLLAPGLAQYVVHGHLLPSQTHSNPRTHLNELHLIAHLRDGRALRIRTVSQGVRLISAQQE